MALSFAQLPSGRSVVCQSFSEGGVGFLHEFFTVPAAFEFARFDAGWGRKRGPVQSVVFRC